MRGGSRLRNSTRSAAKRFVFSSTVFTVAEIHRGFGGLLLKILIQCGGIDLSVRVSLSVANKHMVTFSRKLW